MKPKPIYRLTSTNLTSLGGPMWSEHTTVNFTKYFSSVAFALTHAERDYCGTGKDKRKLDWSWTSDKDGKWTSGDLGFVAYTVEMVEVEK